VVAARPVREPERRPPHRTPRAEASGDGLLDRADPPGAWPGLDLLNVVRGEAVRWQSGPKGRWRQGTVTHRERDGSVGVCDEDGAARSLTVERLEVARPGPRGGRGWEPLIVRAGRAEQLSLL
jgi:hypothetical protein